MASLLGAWGRGGADGKALREREGGGDARHRVANIALGACSWARRPPPLWPRSAGPIVVALRVPILGPRKWSCAEPHAAAHGAVIAPRASLMCLAPARVGLCRSSVLPWGREQQQLCRPQMRAGWIGDVSTADDLTGLLLDLLRSALLSLCFPPCLLSRRLPWSSRLSAGKVPVYCVVAEFVGVFLFQFIGGGADANSISTGLCYQDGRPLC